MLQAVQSTPPATVGNKLTLDVLKAKATELGEQSGKGKDTQVKMLLSCLEGGYHNAIDLSPNKHGAEKDDAVVLAEAYVRAQGTATTFDAKAMNQRKLIACLRTSIKFGQWPKGGNGEPLATVNSLMTERSRVRKDPALCKKLDDAANTFLRFARAQLKRDQLIPAGEFNDFLFKKNKDPATASEVVEKIRNDLDKLLKGDAAGGNAQDNSKLIRDAHRNLTDRLIEIAKASGAGKPGGAKV